MAQKMSHLIRMERHTNTEWRGVIPAAHGSWHTRYVRMSLECKRSCGTLFYHMIALFYRCAGEAYCICVSGLWIISTLPEACILAHS